MAPEGEVGEEGPLGRDGLLVLDPLDGAVDQVLREVVAVLGQPVGLDGVAALVELRVPVVHLRAHEAVEEVEALPHRPARERAGRAHLDRGRLVPLADRRRAVAVAAEDLRDGRGTGGPVAVVARLRRRHLAGDAHPDRVVVATGHQRLPRRRAQRRDVEPAVAQPLVGQPLGGRHLARAAVRRRRAEAHVVDEDDDHVRRARDGLHRPDRAGGGVDVEGQAGAIDHQARRPAMSEAAATASLPSSSKRSSVRRSLGPHTLTIASGRPATSSTGAETPQAVLSNSPLQTA